MSDVRDMKILLSLTFILMALTACGDDAGSGGAPPSSNVRFTVQVLDAQTPDVLEGVELCVADQPDIPCAVSDAQGNVELSLPANSELMIRCEGPEHGPMYMTWTIGDADIDADTFRIVKSGTIDALLGIAGAEAWPEQGAIIANVYSDLDAKEPVAGASFVISPAAGGPVYLDETPLPDPELTATTIGGPGVFFDIEDGEITIRASHEHPCRLGLGWQADTADSVRSRVFAGGLSSVTFVCAP